MSPAVIEAEKKAKADPLGPFLGFIILLVGGGFSWIVAPRRIVWLETTSYVFGFLGPILPITFPPEWPFLTQRLIISGFMFLIFFAIAMIIILSFTSSSTQGENDVTMKQVRERKAGTGTKKKKGRRR